MSYLPGKVFSHALAKRIHKFDFLSTALVKLNGDLMDGPVLVVWDLTPPGKYLPAPLAIVLQLLIRVLRNVNQNLMAVNTAELKLRSTALVQVGLGRLLMRKGLGRIITDGPRPAVCIVEWDMKVIKFEVGHAFRVAGETKCHSALVFDLDGKDDPC